jgi:hypothetical protein
MERLIRRLYQMNKQADQYNKQKKSELKFAEK